MTYRTEFPDFNPADMPAIPEGFADRSWHNETCPSFRDSKRRLTLQVDYANPADRDNPLCVRFALIREDDEPASDADREFVMECEDWESIVAAIAKIDAGPQVGGRVRIIKDVENYPVILLPAGECGTLDHVSDDGSYWVTLDEPHEELAEWDNQIQIMDGTPDQSDDPKAYLEVI